MMLAGTGKVAMRKYMVQHDVLEVPPYVAGEIVEGPWLEGHLNVDEILTAEECEERYPGLLDAWRRGDDSTAERADELDWIAVELHRARIEHMNSLGPADRWDFLVEEIGREAVESHLGPRPELSP